MNPDKVPSAPRAPSGGWGRTDLSIRFRLRNGNGLDSQTRLNRIRSGKDFVRTSRMYWTSPLSFDQ